LNFLEFENKNSRPRISWNLKTKIQGLECPGICKQKFKALNVLEFVKKYLKVLEFFLLYFMVFSKII
jgi:flagellar biosynthesis protein FlhB